MNNKQKLEFIENKWNEFSSLIKRINNEFSYPSTSKNGNYSEKSLNLKCTVKDGRITDMVIYLEDDIQVHLLLNNFKAYFDEEDEPTQINIPANILFTYSDELNKKNYKIKLINIDETAFKHEMIHLMNIKQYGSGDRLKSYNDNIDAEKLVPKDYKKYFNHPEEFNAYLYSSLSKLKDDIKEIKEENEGDNKEIINIVLNQLKRHEQLFAGFYSHLNDENKKKIKKKVYQYIFENKMNITSQLQKLNEDFKFQSRGLEKRKDDKLEMDKNKGMILIDKLIKYPDHNLYWENKDKVDNALESLPKEKLKEFVCTNPYYISSKQIIEKLFTIFSYKENKKIAEIVNKTKNNLHIARRNNTSLNFINYYIHKLSQDQKKISNTDYFLFIGGDDFKEDEDGRYRKTLNIEKLIKVTPKKWNDLSDMNSGNLVHAMKTRTVAQNLQLFQISCHKGLLDEYEGIGSVEMPDYIVMSIDERKVPVRS